MDTIYWIILGVCLVFALVIGLVIFLLIWYEDQVLELLDNTREMITGYVEGFASDDDGSDRSAAGSSFKIRDPLQFGLSVCYYVCLSVCHKSKGNI